MKTEIIPVFTPGQIVMCNYTDSEKTKLTSAGYNPQGFFGVTESVSRPNKAILLGWEIDKIDMGGIGVHYLVSSAYQDRAHHADLNFDNSGQVYSILDLRRRVIRVEPIFDFHEIVTQMARTPNGKIVRLLEELVGNLPR